MTCGLPHDKLDASVASVKELLKSAIENESFPERKLESIWNIYQQLKGIKKDLDHNIVGEDVTFVPDDRFKDVISFTSVLPKEFDLHRFVDYDMQFDKSFVEPLKAIVQLINWNVEPVASLDSFFS